jgi:ATP-dependent DNA helicase PIF1
MKPSPHIEINAEFRRALDIIENTGKNLFVTGRAGTGKSTLLEYFKRTTKKKVAVLAPTGVAALNVKGQTIHSFCRFKPNITTEGVRRLRFDNDRKNIYKKLDAIVIDEISMVRADLLDCVDKFLRLNGRNSEQPFGGTQMVFIGDLYQLPPVVASSEREAFKSLYPTPYFYSAHVFNLLEMEFVELEKVYRQSDKAFIELLNAIRNRTIDDDGLATLNQRYQPEFQPASGTFYIYLVTTNALAEQINSQRLDILRSRGYVFDAVIEGNFGREYLPTAIELQVKAGAQIMMLNNDPAGRWVNGSLGKITDIIQDKEGESVILVELAEGETVAVTPFTWEISNLFLENGELKSEVVGSFTQYPLVLAWAVTIHKGQGKTFQRVVIDFGRGTFAHGQAYVALSRCTSLEGMVLLKPLLKRHILMDFKVVDFLTRFQYRKAAETCSLEARIELIRHAIKEKKNLRIVYLKTSDEKSRRIIRPRSLGEIEYLGKTFLGVRAFCLKRHEERTFRVDRMLEIEEVQDECA